ncbi:MAG: rhomboid family intramembrane serine protease [Hyphomicrobium sp.]|nr:rhomboid family intramembrane serine protease [Hyphomicrobium sp.]
MFVPIGDDNPLKSIGFQYVTVALILINVLVFVVEGAGGGADAAFVSSFALVPQELFQVHVLGGPAPFSADSLAVPERATLFSYMFFHGDIMHLIGNMLFLWVFGDNVEDALGHARYLVFYLACGVAAGLMHAVMLPDSQDALIGASGAVSGVIAAYLMLHPRVGVWVLALKFIPLKISAAWVLGLWIVFQVAMVVVPVSGDPGPTAWWAHIGGLIAGAMLMPVMRRPGVPLFGR